MLIHKPSNTLILKLQDPQKVLSVVPKARTLSYKGQTLTQVNYGLDEAKVLNNLGIAVPSPIHHRYEWAGKYTPMAHQASTSAFLTLNPRAICLNDMGCVDAATEYLSPTGWRRMDEYDGSQVAQWLPEEERYEFVWPTEYVKKPCRVMVNWIGAGINQMLSQEHRVLLYTDDGYEVVPAIDLPEAAATGKAYYIHTGREKRRVFGPDDFFSTSAAPDGFKYCFMVPSTFLLLRRNGCTFATGNTGKTLSVLWAADYLMALGKMKKVLIVGPMSTMHSVWESEVNTHFLFRRRCVVLHGDKRKRLKLLEDPAAKFFIINHDGIKTIEKELLAAGFDAVVVDEAAAFRNASSNRYKTIERITEAAHWVWLLTGTPVPRAPTDAWALSKLLRNPKAPKYFTTFKHSVMTQITQYKWVPKPDAYARAYSILQPGVRYTKAECIDLPPITFSLNECALTAQQQQYYKDMHKHLVMDVQGNQITAANAGVKLSKLLQICCGEVYDSTGTPVAIDAKPRMQACEELIESAANKVVVFVPFTAALDRLAAFLKKKGHTVAVVDGRTSATKRKKIFGEFQEADHPRVLVAHPQTTAHGLTLTAADTTIWYAPVFSLEIFEQANNRMNRPGQTSHMTVTMLHGCWLEREIYAALSRRAQMQDSVLRLYKEEVNKK